jgi:hypothetical protein
LPNKKGEVRFPFNETKTNEKKVNARVTKRIVTRIRIHDHIYKYYAKALLSNISITFSGGDIMKPVYTRFSPDK